MSSLFSSPLGLLALVGVPAVFLLHLYRRRFRPHEVSAVFLWLDPDQSPAAGRKREPLLRSLSFYLELLAALALGLAFAGPRGCIATPGGGGRHFVAVLDNTASMTAMLPEGQRAYEKARELLRERIAELPRGSRVTLVTTGEPPRLLVGPAAYPLASDEALEEWKPLRPGHDALPAIALAEQLSGEADRVLFVTDRLESDTIPEEIEVLAVGSQAVNTGFVRVARERSEESDGDVVLASVAHFGPKGTQTTLRVLSAGTLLHSAKIDLEPESPRHWSFELPAEIPTVTLELAGDAFSVDDRAVLAPTAPRTLALAAALDEERARRLGLAPRGEDSALAPLLAFVQDALEVPADSQTAHLLLCDGLPSPALLGPATWALALRAEPDSSSRSELIGPFLIDKKHPLLRGVTLEGIVWSLQEDLSPLPGAPLVSAGSRPILTEEELPGGRTIFHLNLDPNRSSLQRSPDWPILLANLAELRRAALPGPLRTNLFSGEDLVLRTSPDKRWTLRSPTGVEREASGRDQLLFEDLSEQGEWTLQLENRELKIAVSFADPAESDLRDRGAGTSDPASEFAELRADGGGPALWLALAALLFVLVDWLFLQRRTQA